MSTPPNSGSSLSRETIVDALAALSNELGKRNVIGELCLFGGTVPANRIPIKTKYLVEGLFEEGMI